MTRQCYLQEVTDMEAPVAPLSPNFRTLEKVLDPCHILRIEIENECHIKMIEVLEEIAELL